METINQVLAKTKLKDRILWFDGDVSLTSQSLNNMSSQTTDLHNVFVDVIDDNIKKYNSLVDKNKQIQIKQQCNPLNFEWNIPKKYQQLDIEKYISEKLSEHLSQQKLSINGHKSKIRINRIKQELILFSKLKLFDLLKTIVYIVDILHENNQVWGCGRGSCCASYVLYLIGVHDVDSVKYQLDITEFLHE